MDIVVQNEDLSEITSAIEASKTNRQSEEDILGKPRDTSMMLLYIVLGVIFLITLGVVALKKSKKNKRGRESK
jgi:heme/copper-type cytochrome/quinol oxidase subunit 2